MEPKLVALDEYIKTLFRLYEGLLKAPSIAARFFLDLRLYFNLVKNTMELVGSTQCL